MDLQSLPQYRGLADSPVEPGGWGEKDGHGKSSSTRFRDFVVLSVMIAFCSMIIFCAVVPIWNYHRQAKARYQLQEIQIEDEINRCLL